MCVYKKVFIGNRSKVRTERKTIQKSTPIKKEDKYGKNYSSSLGCYDDPWVSVLFIKHCSSFIALSPSCLAKAK